MKKLATKHQFLKSVIVISLLIFGLSGCKVQLAPEYDKAIVDGVNSASEQTLVFLESVSSGTSEENFSERENKYNELIGAYEALSVKAKARPVPNNKATEKINKLLQAKGVPEISGEYPSSVAFEEIAKTLKKMKKTDKDREISSGGVTLFKGQIMIFLDQAITYESFLKR